MDAGGPPDDHALRHEPCFPHQSYTPGFPPGAPGPHETPDRYIGDFNNANQTNLYVADERVPSASRGPLASDADSWLRTPRRSRSTLHRVLPCGTQQRTHLQARSNNTRYVVAGDAAGEVYSAYFAGAGFRYAQLSGLPSGYVPTKEVLTGLKVNSVVGENMASLELPALAGTSFGTPNVLQRIHDMTRASQSSNLWSIPTDCPQRERRGWMGDAQSSADEALMNFDMHSFYEEFLNKVCVSPLVRCPACAALSIVLLLA